MKISDPLLILLHITNGIEPYKIDYYYSELIKLEYVELLYEKSGDIKYSLTDKGKEKVKIIMKEMGL